MNFCNLVLLVNASNFGLAYSITIILLFYAWLILCSTSLFFCYSYYLVLWLERLFQLLFWSEFLLPTFTCLRFLSLCEYTYFSLVVSFSIGGLTGLLLLLRGLFGLIFLNFRWYFCFNWISGDDLVFLWLSTFYLDGLFTLLAVLTLLSIWSYCHYCLFHSVFYGLFSTDYLVSFDF